MPDATTSTMRSDHKPRPRGAAADAVANPPKLEPVARGESAVYEMKARHAQAAAKEALSDALGHLGNAGDPRAWMKTHPWATAGVGAAAGFVAAAALVPSRRQQAAHRLATLERVLRTEAAVSGKMFATKKKSTSGRLFRLAFRLGRPMLMSLITGAAGGAATGAAAGGAAGDAAADQTAGAAQAAGEGVGDVT